MHAANERGGPLRLRLSPPELGALQLELRVRDGVMTARVTAETEAARTLLLDSLPDLRERLALQDVRLDRFDVDLRDSGQDRTPDRQAGTPGEHERHQQPTRQTHAADVAAPAESARPAPLALSSAARLDVLI